MPKITPPTSLDLGPSFSCHIGVCGGSQGVYPETGVAAFEGKLGREGKTAMANDPFPLGSRGERRGCPGFVEEIYEAL
jgi:hypothetical protein